MEVSVIELGQSPKGINVSPTIQGIEFHQGKKLFGHKYLNKSDTYTSQVTKLIDKPSILMSVRAPVGDVNFVDRPIVIGRGLTAITPIYIGLDYLYYCLLTKKTGLESLSTGTTFKAISGDIVRKIEIPIPPLSEQEEIVKIIALIESAINTIN